jgi:hypothetical protein
MPMHDWTRVDAGIYHHFHGRWLYAIAAALNQGVLPAGYFALADQVVQPFEPDVISLKTEAGNGSHPAAGGTRRSATPPAVGVTEVAHRRARKAGQRRVSVRHVSGDRVVAVLELVSPSNKAGVSDFKAFVAKAVWVLDEGVSLVVIDPFPPTKRDPAGVHAAVWKALTGKQFRPPKDRPLTAASYVGSDELTAFAEPYAVGMNVPTLPLFLDAEEYVNVPLESAYLAAWAEIPGKYRAALEAP